MSNSHMDLLLLSMKWRNKFVALIVVISLSLSLGCSYHVLEVSSAKFKERFSGYSYCNVLQVKQNNNKSCGLSCLVSVGHAWGLEVTEAELMTGIENFEQRDGLTMKDLKMVAHKEALTCFTILLNRFPMELTDHVKRGRPVICAIRVPKYRFGWLNTLLFTKLRHSIASWLVTYKNHYVVVCGVNERKERLLLMDPAHGFVTIGYNEFREYWGEMTFAALLCAK